jgi:hypothetical protein
VRFHQPSTPQQCCLSIIQTAIQHSSSFFQTTLLLLTRFQITSI